MKIANKDWLFELCCKLLRLAPPGAPGKARLARFVLGSNLRRRDVQIPDRFGSKFLVPSLLEPIGFHLLTDGVYEPDVAQYILNYLKPGSIFVDVGANIGVFTVPAAKRVQEAGRVVAVESSPMICSYLRQNVAENYLNNVSIKECAAYDREEHNLPFYEAPIDHFGMGALAPEFDSQPVNVPACMLDRILESEQIQFIDLLKVDTEGFEVTVFRGAEHLLTGARSPWILFEFADWAEARLSAGKVGDAQRILHDWGYDIWRFSDFIKGAAPLNEILLQGFEMLIAHRKSAYGQ
jgi:FkbM family methyltransferase